MSWAAASTCPTPRRTPSSSPTRPPITARPRPRPWRASRSALGVDDAPVGLYDLAAKIGAPLKLKDLGLKETDLDRAADIAVKNPYYNPRPVTREGVRALLDDAFFGRRPVKGKASEEAA